MENKESKQDQDKNEERGRTKEPSDSIGSATSMSTLILWNVNKALVSKPSLDLKAELKEAQNAIKLGLDLSEIARQPPHKRYISCALLAWQQNGHDNVESLCSFLESRDKMSVKTSEESADFRGMCASIESGPPKHAPSSVSNQNPLLSKLGSTASSPYHIPPPLKLPREKGVVIHNVYPFIPSGTNPFYYRCHAPCSKKKSTPKIVQPASQTPEKESPKKENPKEETSVKESPVKGSPVKEQAKPEEDNLQKKIADCCFERGCEEKLRALDNSCQQLLRRLSKLAEREANRVKLLERAESAWVDLELGYTRRHQAVLEKEEDLERQIKNLINERNTCKSVCAELVQLLKPRGDAAEKARDTLKEVEDKLCKIACEKLKLSEAAAYEESLLAEMQCKHSQQDRDLKFKEQQALRKKALIQDQLDAVRGLSYESERAMRAELTGLRDQIKQVSNQLLKEDELLNALQREIEEFQRDKEEIADELTGCQERCDEGMQQKMDELVEKRKQLEELKSRVLECRCKVPIETGVQVKRTPSMAALCQCDPEFRAVEGCSCTSLKTRLLSDLFKDLFNGLSSEINDICLRMPCQLLKCLEDKHSWGKGSNITMNLTKFFSQLLCEELEIAIATSIENYHARWVSATCADVVKKPIPDPYGPEIKGWEDRALACKVEQLATQMAQKMFQEKVDEVMTRANEILATGTQPCECPPEEQSEHIPEELAVYHVQVDQDQNPVNLRGKRNPPISKRMTQNFKDEDKFMKPNRDPDSPKAKSIQKSAPRGQAAEKAKPRPTSPRPKVAAPVNAMPVATTNKALNSKKALQKSSILNSSKTGGTAESIHEYWQRTQEEFSQLRVLIEEVKQVHLKKNNLSEKNQVPNSNKYTKLANRGALAISKDIEMPSVENPAHKNKRKVTNRGAITENHPESKNKRVVDGNVKPKGITEIKLRKKNNTIFSDRTYAVNYVCYCGMHKRMCKVKPESSNHLQNLQTTSLNIKNDPIVAFPMITSKISQQKGTQPIPILLKDKSSCECFNKTPSTTSIDKLVETFTQWKFELEGPTNDKDTIKKAYGSQYDTTDTVTNMYDAAKLVCLSDVTNLSSIKGHANKESFEKNKLLLESLRTLPTECKATVNLCKSNEQGPAKSNDENNKIILQNEKTAYRQNIDFETTKGNNKRQKTKCRKQNVDICNESALRKDLSEENVIALQNYDVLHMSQSKIIRVPIETDRKEHILNNIISNDEQKPNVIHLSSSKLVRDNTQTLHTLMKSLSSGRLQKTQNDLHFPTNKILQIPSKRECVGSYSKVRPSQDTVAVDHSCACGYQIKFLGVTLANPNLDKLNGNPKTTKLNNQSQQRKGLIKNMDVLTNQASMKNMDSWEMKGYRTISNHLLEHGSEYNKEIGGWTDSKNNTGLKHSSSDIIENEEKCICCVKVSGESRNLEANTFQLLEEHLKRKLASRKARSNYLVDPNEEEKIVSKMFERLKYTIAELTTQSQCKCAEEVDEKGSWQRAYILLKEYLRIKVSRVHCSCSPFRADEVQSMLPELTEKVCNLIENDFERLMDIAKCNSFENQTPTRTEERLKRDNVQICFKELNGRKELFTVVQTENLVSMSTQVVPNLDTVSVQLLPELDNKLCETTNTETQEVITVETQSDSINAILGQNTRLSNQSVHESVLRKSYGQPTFTYLKESKNAVLEKKTINKHNCDEDIFSAQRNRAKINELLNKHITHNSHDHSLSYIMDAVYKNRTSVTHAKLDKEDNIYEEEPHDEHRKVYDTKINPMEIQSSLTDSRENIRKSYSHTKACHSVSDSDHHDLDRGSHHNTKRIKDKCVHFMSSYEQNAGERIGDEIVRIMDAQGSGSDCDCNMVPLCHVKMLMENIENKLTNSDCVCDSLNSSVCPVHASAVQPNVD